MCATGARDTEGGVLCGYPVSVTKQPNEEDLWTICGTDASFEGLRGATENLVIWPLRVKMLPT